MAMNHDDWVRSRRWVNRLGQEHDPQRNDFDQYVNLQCITEELEANDADKRCAEMTTDQGAGLRGGCAGEPEEKDGRAAEGCKEDW